MNVLDSISRSLGVRSPETCKSKNVEERTSGSQGPEDWREGRIRATGRENFRVKNQQNRSECHYVPRANSCGGKSCKTNPQISISYSGC